MYVRTHTHRKPQLLRVYTPEYYLVCSVNKVIYYGRSSVTVSRIRCQDTSRRYKYVRVATNKYQEKHKKTLQPSTSTYVYTPLTEPGVGARSFAGDPEGCCVGRAWHGRAAAGGRVAHGRAIPTRGILKQAYQVAVMILNETTTTRTEQHYVINKDAQY